MNIRTKFDSVGIKDVLIKGSADGQELIIVYENGSDHMKIEYTDDVEVIISKIIHQKTMRKRKEKLLKLKLNS